MMRPNACVFARRLVEKLPELNRIVLECGLKIGNPLCVCFAALCSRQAITRDERSRRERVHYEGRLPRTFLFRSVSWTNFNVLQAETGDIERALLEEAHGGDGRSLETATAAGQLCFENFNKKMNALIQQEVKSRGLL